MKPIDEYLGHDRSATLLFSGPVGSLYSVHWYNSKNQASHKYLCELTEAVTVEDSKLEEKAGIAAIPSRYFWTPNLVIACMTIGGVDADNVDPTGQFFLL